MIPKHKKLKKASVVILDRTTGFMKMIIILELDIDTV